MSATKVNPRLLVSIRMPKRMSFKSDGVGDDPINPDGCKQQRHCGKNANQERRKTPHECCWRRTDQFFHRAHIEDCYVWLERPNFIANYGGQSGRVSIRANDK